VQLARLPDAMRSPERADAPVRVVNLDGDGIALRRCGRDQCAVIGRLPAGRQRLVILDSQSGWQLVANSGGSAGWAPTDRLYGSN
ncbi:SH3 domain-containing protein, partial [Zavarzinia sp.]|uniref:SH3 domain-containing protein n=1 Tax=Zavarzinia sp. TaxID=2027920 RepID=UPI003BB651E6